MGLLRPALYGGKQKCVKGINSQWWICSSECAVFTSAFHCLSRHQEEKYIVQVINRSSCSIVQAHSKPIWRNARGSASLRLSPSEPRLFMSTQQCFQARCVATVAQRWPQMCLANCYSAVRHELGELHDRVSVGEWTQKTAKHCTLN